MNSDVNGETDTALFEDLHCTAIAALSSPEASHSQSYIHGTVVLIWPYSSSNGSVSLLVADRNVHLRRRKGQVKVTFHGRCAKEVASTRVGIGDTVRLALQGSEWVNTGETVSTPGKKIEWDLHYSRKVVLGVQREGEQAVLVKYDGSESPSVVPISPSNDQSNNGPTNGVRDDMTNLVTTEFSSPMFVHPKRFSSGSFLDASLDPFADDDGFVVGKGRKRTKFARHSGSWRLLDDSSDSQEDVNHLQNGIVTETEASPRREEDIQAIEQSRILPTPAPIPAPSHQLLVQRHRDMPPPQIPGIGLRLPRPYVQSSVQTLDGHDRSHAEETPRLHPLASPGLPLVSPLVKQPGVATGYFPPVDGNVSELDASGEESSPGANELSSSTETRQVPEVISLISPDDGVFPMSVRLHHHSAESEEIRMQEPIIRSGDEKSDEGVQIVEENEHREESVASSIRDLGAKSNEFEFIELSPEIAQVPSFRQSQEPSDSATAIQPSHALYEDEDMYSSPQARPVRGADRMGMQEPDVISVAGSDLSPALGKTAATPHPTEEISRDWVADVQVPPTEGNVGLQISPSQFNFPNTWPDTQIEQHGSPALRQSFDGAVDEFTQTGELESSSVISHDGVVAQEYPQSPELRSSPPREESSQVNESERITIGLGPPTADSNISLKVPLSTSSQVLQLTDDKVPSADIVPKQPVPRERADHPLTPENTQQEEAINVVSPKTTHEPSLPPTPQDTQEAQITSLEDMDIIPAGSEEGEATAQESAPQPGTSESTSITTRRKSQRVRKSLPLDNISQISSPYFAPRRSGRMRITPPPSSPTRKENLSPLRSPPTSPLKETPGFAQSETPHTFREKPNKPSTVVRTRGLSTPVSYYPLLATVSEFFSTPIDVLAICVTTTSEPQLAKKGPRDHYCTLQLTDSSLPLHEHVIAQIFRPSKLALPSAVRGSVILLRNMKVQSQKGKCMLLSTNVSSWAVFAHPEHAYTKASILGVTVAGPPVEYGPGERVGAVELMQWWDREGTNLHPLSKAKERAGAKNQPPNGRLDDHRNGTIKSETSNGVVQTPRRSRRLANYTDHIGSGEEDDRSATRMKRSPRPSDASMVSQKTHTASSTRSRRSESLVHELRDGNKWTDEDKDEIRKRGRRDGSLVHELRDGTHYIDE